MVEIVSGEIGVITIDVFCYHSRVLTLQSATVRFLRGGRGNPEERRIIEVFPKDDMIAETIVIGKVTAVFDRQISGNLDAVDGGSTGFLGWWGVCAVPR